MSKLIYKANKPYTEDINDLVESDELNKGRGPDKQPRKKRGTGPRHEDEYHHNKMMAAYHETREKHHANTSIDFNSSSDKDLHQAAKHHDKKREHHERERSKYAKKRDSTYNREKHGPSKLPSSDEAHSYGRKYYGKDEYNSWRDRKIAENNEKIYGPGHKTKPKLPTD